MTPAPSLPLDLDKPVKLWCVHARGPSDLIPVADYAEAERLCDVLLAIDRKSASDPLMPFYSALPMLWPDDTGSHAEWMKKRADKNADYPFSMSAVPGESP